MIYGVGVDIAKVSRFKKWVLNEEMLERFFALGEIIKNGSELHKCEHYASRFAVKEAFSKRRPFTAFFLFLAPKRPLL